MIARRLPSDDAIAAAFRRDWARAGRAPLPVAAVAACVEQAREALTGGAIQRRAAARADRRRPVPAFAAEVIAAVARARHHEPAELTGNDIRRIDGPADARHEAEWVLAQRGLSVRQVGRAMGDRTPGAVQPGIAKVQARVDADPAYGQELLAIAAGAGDELAARRRSA